MSATIGREVVKWWREQKGSLEMLEVEIDLAVTQALLQGLRAELDEVDEAIEGAEVVEVGLLNRKDELLEKQGVQQ